MDKMEYAIHGKGGDPMSFLRKKHKGVLVPNVDDLDSLDSDNEGENVLRFRDMTPSLNNTSLATILI